MVEGQRVNQLDYLESCKAELEIAKASGEQKRIALAMAKTGFAFFGENNPEEALRYLDEAQVIAIQSGDIKIQVHCLGLKVLGFQSVNRLPDAYKASDEILKIARENKDLGVECDVLASQAQILLDSGEPETAYQRLLNARKIAEQLKDNRRLMDVLGALGHHSLEVADADLAEDYFRKARTLSIKLYDRPAEIGFLGNIGVVMEWKGQFERAAVAFKEVLEYLEETGDRDAQLQVCSHLVDVYTKLENDYYIQHYARRGLTLSKKSRTEHVYKFYAAQIMVYYRKGNTDMADRTTTEAIQRARSTNDLALELNFRLSLGESYVIAGEYGHALEHYKKARARAAKLNRHSDEAYIAGRIGVALAELGKIDEAIGYHNEALEIARQMNLPDLEGEQLTMLAIAYSDKGDIDSAKSFCRKSIDVFDDADMIDEAEKARQLLEKL